MIDKIKQIMGFSRDAFWNVPLFASLMIRKLWRNRHKYIIGKGHWSNDPAWGWMARAGDELRELKDEMEREANGDYEFISQAGQRKWEAADVANFAMMAGLAKSVDGDPVVTEERERHE